MILAYACAVLLWLSMITYAVLGGADFGGGIWDLFSLGSEQDEKRQLIVHALGPVWEANNVWLIYLVVGLFTAFPGVAATLATALFIPFSLILIGVVFRGASFAFRTQFSGTLTLREIWGRAFGIASMITPFLLGTCAAAVASGHIRMQHGQPPVAVWEAWLSPFALTIGAMGLALCATIAPIYLTVEAQKRKKTQLAETFRKRAFIGGTFLAALSLLGLLLAPSQAPLLWHGMLDHALWAVGVTVVLGIATAIALFTRHYQVARLLIILETGALLGTWGLSQLPYILPPDLTIVEAASPPATLAQFFVCALIGMLVLIPSLWFLFHVFKNQDIVPPVHEKEVKEA